MTKLNKWMPLFSTQFLGVLNDNVLKNAIIFIGIFWLAKDDQSMVIPVASALLVLPFLLLSPLAGKWAQTYSKKRIFEIAKLMEIPIMVIASVGFYMQSIYVVMGAMLLMGVQSALYSPSKYGLIRDVGGVEEVSFGIGTMELLTFVAVLIGQVSAGIISDLPQHATLIVCLFMLLLAIIGWITCRNIKVTEPPATEQIQDSANPFSYLYDSYKWSKKIKGLNYTILGLGGFWLVASMLQMNIYLHAPGYYGMSNTETSIVMALIAIGIGAGCWVAGIVSKNRVEIGMVPLGGIGLSICLTIFATVDLNTTAFIILLVIAAFFSGFYKVPLNAWLQERVEGRKLGNILAYNNMVAFAFILVAAGIFGYFSTAFDTSAVFIVLAVLSWVMTVITFLNIPSMMVRFIADTLARIYFKYEVTGREFIPKKTGALIVANHLSLLDPLMIVAVAPRMVRFVMAQELYEHPAINWLVRRLNVIPVASKSEKDRLVKFNQLCQQEINEGHIVCIFPEGQISRIGHLLEFKRGIEHIAKGINAPIIPIQMEGVKGTPFSFETGSSSPVKKLTSFRKKIHVAIGQPIEPPVSAYLVRQQMQELNADTFQKRIKMHHSLNFFLDKKAGQHSNKNILSDENGKKYSYQSIMQQVSIIQQQLSESVDGQPKIGVCIPHSSHAMLANVALAGMQKISVNIPASSDENELEKIIQEQGLQTILLSKESDVDAGRFGNLACHYMEDLLSITNHGKYAKKVEAINKEQLVAILYERNDKGKLEKILLTHENILATIKGLMQTHTLGVNDKMLSVIPADTYYGYIFNTWLPLLLGVEMVHSTNGIKEIAHKILAEKVNVLLANNVFVEQLYQYDESEVWKTLNYVLTGITPVKSEIREKLQQQFKLHVSESLSFTDIGTLISVNTPDYNLVDVSGHAIDQPGTKGHSYGRCVPGLAVKTVNPDNYDEVMEVDEKGILLVKGAAISNQNGRSKDKFHNDWFITGQLCSIDSHGFIRLED